MIKDEMIQIMGEIAEQNENIEKELVEIDTKVKELELDRLKKVIGIVIKGIKFQSIEKLWITYNNHNSFYSDEIEYFMNEHGKRLKGVKLVTLTLNSNSSVYGGDKTQKELFLIEDGTFTVFIHDIQESNWQDSKNRYTRKCAKNQDVFQFDIDDVISAIEWKLNDRLNSLGDRKKTQLNRLNKLIELKVS